MRERMKSKRLWEGQSEGLLIEWGGEEEKREMQGNREEMG